MATRASKRTNSAQPSGRMLPSRENSVGGAGGGTTPSRRAARCIGRCRRTTPRASITALIPAIDYLAGEDDLVAHLHAGLAPRAEVERARPRPWDEVERAGDQPPRAERL